MKSQTRRTDDLQSTHFERLPKFRCWSHNHILVKSNDVFPVQVLRVHVLYASSFHCFCVLAPSVACFDLSGGIIVDHPLAGRDSGLSRGGSRTPLYQGEVNDHFVDMSLRSWSKWRSFYVCFIMWRSSRVMHCALK